MQKQKIKKITAKLLLALFIINAICIFNFAIPTSAVGGDLNVVATPDEVCLNDLITVDWRTHTLFASSPYGYIEYGGYYFELYKNVNDQGWELIDDDYGSTSYEYLTESEGTVQFRVKEYADWRKSVSMGETSIDYGPFFICAESSNIVNIIDPILAIDLITPIDGQIYNEPMEGYYLGTYGFENDEIGSTPSDWIDASGSGTSVMVAEEVDNHKMVIDCYDGSSANGFDISNYFSDQEFGTIEFYIRADTTASTWTTMLFSDGTSEAFHMTFFLNRFSWYGGGKWHHIQSASANTWYHISIDFECTTSGYMGLSQYQFNFKIDGVDHIIDFKWDQPKLNKFRIKSQRTYSSFHTYYDAIGFSWDPDYKIGDNLNEGILFSFTTDIDLDTTWCKYDDKKFDLFGNTVFSIYNGGTHNLQIFGKDSAETVYRSNKHEFSFEPEGWDPKPLIGSSDRAFPIEDDSKLGFTIQSSQRFKQTPQLHFGINQTSDSDQYVDLNIEVDGNIIHTYNNLILESNIIFEDVLLVDELTTLIGHKIEIEIIDDDSSNNNIYRLEYLEIGRLNFRENLIYEDGTIHTPTMLHTFGIEANNAHVTFNMKPAYGVHNGEDGKVINDNDFSYRPYITIQLDKDTTTYNKEMPMPGFTGNLCYDYIHSVSMDYKIIDKFGNLYVPPTGIRDSVESSNTAEGHEDQIAYWTMRGIEAFLLISSEFPYVGWLGYINYALGWIGDPEYNNAWWDVEDIEPGHSGSYWEVGHSRWGLSVEPIPKTFTNVTVSTDVIEDTYTETPIGAYQIQVGWSVNIWTVEEVGIISGCDIYYKETISGNYYSNFVYEVI